MRIIILPSLSTAEHFLPALNDSACFNWAHCAGYADFGLRSKWAALSNGDEFGIELHTMTEIVECSVTTFNPTLHVTWTFTSDSKKWILRTSRL